MAVARILKRGGCFRNAPIAKEEFEEKFPTTY